MVPGAMKRRERNAEATDPSTISSVRLPRNISVREAKIFWQNQRKEGNVDVIFKEVQSKLQLLCEKIKDGSATNKDYVRAQFLVNEADLEDYEACHCDFAEDLSEHKDCPLVRTEEPLSISTSSELSKCACLQFTASKPGKDVPSPKRGIAPGYKYKRLQTPIPTGLYECNVSCKCDRKMCQNRVVQHGLQVRLQVFKTKGKGWGVRCLDDLDKGTFVCIYAGQILIKTAEVNIGQDSVVQTHEKKTASIYAPKKRCSHSDSEITASPSISSIIQNFRTTPHLQGSSWAELKRKGLGHVKGGKSDFTCIKRPKTKTAILQKRRRELMEEGTVTMQHSSDDEPFTPPASPKVQHPGDHEDKVENVEVIHTRGNSVRSNEAGYVSDESSSSVQGGSKENFDSPDSNTEERIYFLDASTEGNVGRFLNHSCSPNLFVQHVFVETHSKKFPWVAFFTKSFIKAGTELTWEYNYDIGSVAEKEISCLCGHNKCKNVII